MPISEKDLEKAAEIVRHVMRGSTESTGTLDKIHGWAHRFFSANSLTIRELLRTDYSGCMLPAN